MQKPKRGPKIKDWISIEQRTGHIENREEIGHWEGDLVIGKGQKSAIETIDERKSRYTYIVKLKDRKSATVRKQFVDVFKALGKNLTKTMTYDNGVEMAQRKELIKQTGELFISHTHTLLGKRVRTKTQTGLLDAISPRELILTTLFKYVQNNLNNRPRKVSNYKTAKAILLQSSA